MLSGIRRFLKRKLSSRYKFNLQYEENKWDGLRELDELGRYSLIIGYCRHFAPGGRLLDLGCGEGVLLEQLPAGSYSSYFGIDFSDVAIANASRLQRNSSEFVTGDMNRLSVTGLFDAIIFNESLYYVNNPEQVVSGLFANLSPGGVFIVSMVDKHGEERTAIWDKLDSLLTAADKSRIYNHKGDSWTLKVYKIPGQGKT